MGVDTTLRVQPRSANALSRHCAFHSITSSARNRREVGIVSLIYKRLRWGCASGDLVLRFGREIAGVMSFVQLFFKRPAGSVDHPPAFDGQALADFFRPP